MFTSEFLHYEQQPCGNIIIDIGCIVRMLQYNITGFYIYILRVTEHNYRHQNYNESNMQPFSCM